MEDKKQNYQDLENPTLALKLSDLLSKSWNRDLRDEQVHQNTISRLRGNPILVVQAESQKDREWSTDRLVESFKL